MKGEDHGCHDRDRPYAGDDDDIQMRALPTATAAPGSSASLKISLRSCHTLRHILGDASSRAWPSTRQRSRPRAGALRGITASWTRRRIEQTPTSLERLCIRRLPPSASCDSMSRTAAAFSSRSARTRRTSFIASARRSAAVGCNTYERSALTYVMLITLKW